MWLLNVLHLVAYTSCALLGQHVLSSKAPRMHTGPGVLAGG